MLNIMLVSVLTSTASPLIKQLIVGRHSQITELTNSWALFHTNISKMISIRTRSGIIIVFSISISFNGAIILNFDLESSGFFFRVKCAFFYGFGVELNFVVDFVHMLLQLRHLLFYTNFLLFEHIQTLLKR